MTANSRAVTAYHEAGHAVAALVLGRPVAWVSVRPDRKFLAICAFAKGVFRPPEDWAAREAIIALAAPAAEAGLPGEPDWAGAAHVHDYGSAGLRMGWRRPSGRLAGEGGCRPITCWVGRGSAVERTAELVRRGNQRPVATPVRAATAAGDLFGGTETRR